MLSAGSAVDHALKRLDREILLALLEMPVDQEAQGRQPGRILAQGGARPPDHFVGVVVLQRHDALDQVGAAMAAGALEHVVG